MSAKGSKKSKKNFYAVAKGLKTGIFPTWDECKPLVTGFPGAKFKGFATCEEAKGFLEHHSASTNESDSIGSSSASSATNGIAHQQKRKFHSMVRKRPDEKEAVRTAKRPRQALLCPALPMKTPGVGVATHEDDRGFFVDDDGFVHVYTDGACPNNGNGATRAGIGVWFNDDHASNVSKPVSANKRATNNVAEILAAVEAVKMARASGINKLLINTDSNFMIQCMNEWVPNWKLCGWKTSKGTAVKNKDELLELEAAIRGEEDQEPIDIVWNHVRGHKGLKGNECADRLAVQGSKMTIA